MKRMPVYKCEWCGEQFVGVSFYASAEELDELIKKSLLWNTHACDDRRQGLGRLIGFKKLQGFNS